MSFSLAFLGNGDDRNLSVFVARRRHRQRILNSLRICILNQVCKFAPRIQMMLLQVPVNCGICEQALNASTDYRESQDIYTICLACNGEFADQRLGGLFEQDARVWVVPLLWLFGGLYEEFRFRDTKNYRSERRRKV